MRRLNMRAPRIAGLLALALGALAFLALSGVATAKDHGDNHGHGRHHHHHHRFPLQEAGKISSFDATTGKLTIALLDGEAVTGMVTEETRIRCEGNNHRRFDRRDQGGNGNEPGDDNRGRGNEPGDDNGGHNEPGDDHGGDNSGSGGPGPGNSSGPGPSGEGEPAPGEASCTVASLVPGAVVGEAELRLEGGLASFTEIDLGSDS
ncbi:MAG TPA: hypothetical protein VH299_02740 [Solirubrobacterales bacterium]|nr:hypothetical protein [Solirubrobacterales bacterium]